MSFLTHPLLWLPMLAVIIDYYIGDPPSIPHPVRWIGALLDRQETFLRKHCSGFLKPMGILAVIINAAVIGTVVHLLCSIPYLGWGFWLYFAYSGLALGQLLIEGRVALRLVEKGDIEQARTAVGRLVSRDLSEADAGELRRALAETMSENFNDGFVAPLFFLCIGGPGLLWAYKTVSTMDSMWGYKTDEYVDLGFGGAKADDIFAYVPAHISAFAMMGAGWFMKLDVNAAFDNVREQAQACESPNAGWPMATAAWLAGARMGGSTMYFGKIKEKPILGPEGEWTGDKLALVLRLLRNAGVLCTICIVLYFLMVFAAH